VFTYHNDNARTGLNSGETKLTPAYVNEKQFGKIFSYALDGDVYAQPLYVSNLHFSDGTHNVVYVATQHDSVYAYDADGGSTNPLWVRSFLDPANDVTTLPGDELIAEEIGITGTPVIDPASNTLYVVAATKENSHAVLRLHALDLARGMEKSPGPIVIQGSVSGAGVANDGNGKVVFDPDFHLQRAALLLSGGVVYVAFGSHADNGPYHGWLFAYDAATLSQIALYCVTPNGSQGAIWMSGGGPARTSSQEQSVRVRYRCRELTNGLAF
jgi:hypothetical protein